MLNKEHLIIWVSDFSDNTGEGVLADYFIKFLLKRYKSHRIEIKSFDRTYTSINNRLKNKNFVKKSFFHKYIEPFYGVLYLWKNRNKKIVYVNYLPLWNFILLFLLPQKTILGPITGGVYFGKVKNFNHFLRKYIFYLFYKISLSFIFKKFNNIIFSTYLLKKYVDKIHYKKILFNFALVAFNRKIKIKKKFDIIFYNREHPTKKTTSLEKIIKYLSLKFKICVIGDYFKGNKNILNLGYVSRIKTHQLLKESKITFSSSENLMSLFNIDALNNCNYIFYEKILGQEWPNKSRYFISCNYKLPLIVHKKVSYYLNINKKVDDTTFENFAKAYRKKFIRFLDNY